LAFLVNLKVENFQSNSNSFIAFLAIYV